MRRHVVGARELKTRLGTYLRRVREGHTLLVTDRGEAVAELRPIAADSNPEAALRRLSIAGTVSLPRTSLRPFRPIRSKGKALSEAIVEDREDRF